MTVTCKGIISSVARARWAILSLALTYALSVLAGGVMAHKGSTYALSHRDSLVARAHSQDPSALAYDRGNRFSAAFIDFGRNLVLGAVPSTVSGVALIMPYPVAAYRGWVGGIVSVDNAHRSRLSAPTEGAYYLLVLVLQLISYSLAGGAGIRLGWTLFRRSSLPGAKWFDLPKDALMDVLRIYVLVVPLFLIASLVEFLWP
jgi:hypothetical protein